MKFRTRSTLLLILILVCLVGVWLGGKSEQAAPAAEPEESRTTRPRAPRIPAGGFSEAAEVQIQDGLEVEVFASTQADQIIVRFPDDPSYGAFVSGFKGTRVKLLARLDPLRAVRLGFEEWTDLVMLLAEANVTRYATLPEIPEPPPAAESVQRGLVPFGNRALPWLGAAAERSKWGAGVRVAVIDSGIVPHVGLPSVESSVDVSAKPGSDVSHLHGTAVASLIAGSDPRAPGVAPAVSLVSINVFDDTGRADSFAVAAGLLAAIDSCAHVVNMSLGSNEDNPLIREAVAMVQARGIVIVAASGNSAGSRAAFPAAYPGVISVGAIDARGIQLDFSNYGDALSITAPGYHVSAAIPGDRFALMSGTSVSVPLVTATIAATMANGNPVKLSAEQATRIVLDHADEAGIPGPDSQYGFGILNIGRIMSRTEPGIVDAAITYQEIVEGGINVTLQNRGTAALINLLLEVRAAGGSRKLNITTLSPRAVQTFFVAVPFQGNDPRTVSSIVYTGSNGPDRKPEDNVLSQSFSGR